MISVVSFSVCCGFAATICSVCCRTTATICLLLPSNYRYYQEHHQPDVRQHYLAVSKSLACDGAERHVVVVPPFQKSLLHDYFVFSYTFCALCSTCGLATAISHITDFVRMVIACSPYLRRLAPLLLPGVDLLPDLLTLSVGFCGRWRTRTRDLPQYVGRNLQVRTLSN